MEKPSTVIEKLMVRGFRNLEPLEWNPGSRLNVIHGDNGAGKSSLLEAIYYVGSLSSFRGARAEDMIQTTQTSAHIKALISSKPLAQSFEISISKNDPRKMAINQKRPKSISHWRNVIHMVLFHPGDLLLTAGSSEQRRTFLDEILEQIDSIYASTQSSYQKALRSRNRLLKEEKVDRKSVEAFDEILSMTGAIITRCRDTLINELRPHVMGAFKNIFGDELPIDITYMPRVFSDPKKIKQKLRESFDKDLLRKFTAEGPHADDILFQLREEKARHHASQGQHRVLALALRFAQLQVLAEKTGVIPILLLDDVSSELDRVRNQRFFEMLAQSGSQVFLTTTHPDFIRINAKRVDFFVEKGKLVNHMNYSLHELHQQSYE